MGSKVLSTAKFVGGFANMEDKSSSDPVAGAGTDGAVCEEEDGPKP